MYDDSDYINPSKHDYLLNLCRYIYIYFFKKQTNREIIQPYVA